MTSTGVLPFVRGIDLSGNDFAATDFPAVVGSMTGLRWLKLNNTGLAKVPDVMSQLKSLENVQMNGNTIASVHGELSDLPQLRSVVCRGNQLKTSGIPDDIFKLPDMSIIDFSRNQLRDLPITLDHAKGAIVLNVAHNNIEQLPTSIFMSLLDLQILDVSFNRLEVIPPQLRRLKELRILVINDNPLEPHCQLRQIPDLHQLRVLHLRSTHRTIQNIPVDLDSCELLEDVDLSQNDLIAVPDSLYRLKHMKRLNLSDNRISTLGADSVVTDCWSKIRVLNCSRNRIAALPAALISRWTQLRTLMLNENQINFEGLPASVGKLLSLETLQLAQNCLELIPEGVCRCVKLKRLKLNDNKLVTLPESVHLLPDLLELDVRGNEDLVMPPKPVEKQKAALAFYNIDFSLQHQLELAGAGSDQVAVEPAVPIKEKDKVARKIDFLKRRKQSAAEGDAGKVLKGMAEVVKDREHAEQEMQRQQALQQKKVEESIKRPELDYSDFFDEDTGTDAGLTIWEIENFLPNPLEEAFHGSFYEADCYIILETFLTESQNLDYRIFFWIGEEASLDKKACAAIHAVNLRNYLGATCRTMREEMNDESDEFLRLFNDEITYIEGGRTLSGFYQAEANEIPPRLFIVTAKGAHINLEPVALSIDSLDPRFVFLLITKSQFWVWCGRKSPSVLRSKTRLFAEKSNKIDMKDTCDIEVVRQDEESNEFWIDLGIDADEALTSKIVEHVPPVEKAWKPKLYRVGLGMGYLELPQIELRREEDLKQDLLETRCVYILDCLSDIFIWIGKKSTRLVRAAGLKLATELHVMISRPEYALVNRVCEGTESMMFKSKFTGWDDVLAVDFTRTAESITRRGADLKIIMERDQLKTDLSALFYERQPMQTQEEADIELEDLNADLELIEPFVLQGKKFVRLPDDEFGVFYSMDCYVFLCRYWMPPEDVEDEEATEGKEVNSSSSAATSSKETTPESLRDENSEEVTDEAAPEDDFRCVVYFWQGRDASNMGWLTFTFSLQKKFESLFKDKLEVVRLHQQQEHKKFLAHFKKQFIIRRGRRSMNLFPGVRRWPELYHIRANGTSVCTRTIQTDLKTEMNANFVYILCHPYSVPDSDGLKGRTYVWMGSKACENDLELAVAIAEKHITRDNEYPISVLKEGQEPEEFFSVLTAGGKEARKPIDADAEFLKYARLFRCTNEKGYFCVSEKTMDFCQEDLNDDDVMLLDNGVQVFLWMGASSSEVEVKLAYKSAQVYIQHLRLKQPDRPRKLCLTLKGKESKRFTKCFHAWTKQVRL